MGGCGIWDLRVMVCEELEGVVCGTLYSCGVPKILEDVVCGGTLWVIECEVSEGVGHCGIWHR